MQQTYDLSSVEATRALGARIGGRVRGGEVLELSGDVGTGKTTFVKGLGEGMGVDEVIQSPSFTISRVYDTPGGVTLYHYDFYRLSEPGIMRDELADSLHDPANVVAIEWDDTVRDVLPPEQTVQVQFVYSSDATRRVKITIPAKLAYLCEEAK